MIGTMIDPTMGSATIGTMMDRYHLILLGRRLDPPAIHCPVMLHHLRANGSFMWSLV